MSPNRRPGEEFRDDERRRGRLPPDLVKTLTRLDDSRSALAVAGTVGVLGAAIAAPLLWWSAWVILPALVVIAGKQHALFVLAHDAAHYRLFERRWLNELVGRALGTAGGVSMCTYRVVHRLHHNHLYESVDPDLPLHAGYPRGRAYLVKKLLKDVAGLTSWKTFAYFFGAPALNAATGAASRPLDDTSPALRRAARQDRWIVAGFHVSAPVLAFAAGYGVEYLVLWPLPLLTLLQPLLRFRAVCEHGAVADTSSPLKAARTNFAPPWLRWALFPHHVHYHLEHHLYPAVPHYNLARCHAELRRRGFLDDAEVRTLAATARIVMAPRARPA